jgi:hypothetical protein
MTVVKEVLPGRAVKVAINKKLSDNNNTNMLVCFSGPLFTMLIAYLFGTHGLQGSRMRTGSGLSPLGGIYPYLGILTGTSCRCRPGFYGRTSRGTVDPEKLRNAALPLNPI